MGQIRVDLSYLPIYVITYDGAVSDDAFLAHLDEVERTLYGSGSRERVLLQDARHFSPVPSTQRRMQAAWIKRHEPRLRELTYGAAFVFDSAIVRGVLTAILWLQPLPFVHEVCATLDQGVDWAERILAARGIRYTSAMREALLSEHGGLKQGAQRSG